MLLNNFTLACGRHGVAHLISPSLGPIRCYVKACNTKLRALGSNERQVPPGPGKSGNRKGSRPERNSAVSSSTRRYCAILLLRILFLLLLVLLSHISSSTKASPSA